MATIADISQVLGDHMLRGWVLTDQSCPTPGCTVPMLRSPKGRTPVTSFCVKCNNNETPSVNKAEEVAPSSNTSAGSGHSAMSTPPTEFSPAPGSPVFIPLEESEESRQRRAQSDQASSEIGSRLLKGWAMLGEECPNSTCYGVPLVRPPKRGPEKDPRKECVICGRVYVKEVDWAGRENLVLQSKASDLSTSVQSQAGSSSPDHTGFPGTFPFSSPFGRETKETKQKIPVETVQVRTPKPASASPSTPSKEIMSDASQALENTLGVLTGRITALSSQSILDTMSIGTTADAINKVALALAQVQKLQNNQSSS